MEQTQWLFFKCFSHLSLQLLALLVGAASFAIFSPDLLGFLVLHSMIFWSSSVHGRVSDPLVGCDLSITDFPAEMEEINPIKLLPWNILQENK